MTVNHAGKQGKWPAQSVPLEFLKAARELVEAQTVSKNDFLELCVFARQIIDSGRTTTQARNGMSFYIANLWTRHENIASDELLNDIGGQFAEWEIPGTFDLNREVYVEKWERLKLWILLAANQLNEPHKPK